MRRWWVVLERFSASSTPSVELREAWWRDQGYAPKRLPAGLQLSAAEGGPLDARATLLALQAPDEPSARALAERLEAIDGVRRAPLASVEAPARGLLRATLSAPRRPRGALEVSARDVLWLSPAGDSPIELTTLSLIHI